MYGVVVVLDNNYDDLLLFSLMFDDVTPCIGCEARQERRKKSFHFFFFPLVLLIFIFFMMH